MGSVGESSQASRSLSYLNLLVILYRFKMNPITKALALVLCAAIASSLPQRQNSRNKFQFYELPNQHVPKAIQTYYDKLMSFPGHVKYGQNLTLVEETVTKDWNTRPNPVNPGYGIETGPFPQGLKAMLELKSKMLKNIRVKRNETYVIHEDGHKIVVVVCRIKATMNEVPQGYPGYPMFPGIEAEKLKGKSFESMKMDVHYMCQETNKIRRTYHFEDWTLALDEMLTGRRPFKFHQPYVKPALNLTEVPQSIENFYDGILSDVKVGGKNTTLLEETVHDDWSSRPNYINLVDGKGPGLNGLKGLTGLFAQIMPDMKFERKRVWIHGDKVIVISHVTANITGRPKGQKEVPLFPGIPAEKLMNKEFKTIALDIHKIVDGKIKQSYHIEDWHTALEQMLYEKEAPCFGLYPDFTNFHVPKPIKTFYDQILSNPGHIEYGQNMTLINQTFAEDWNIRPNPFSKEQGIEAGPFPKGLKQMTGMWHQMMPDIEVERLQTIRMGNKVAVISQLSATMRDVPQGLDEYPMFPGIPADQLKGKNFSTLCLAVHVLDDEEHHHDDYEHQHERIRRSWAIEDWTEAADQMLHNRRPAKLDHPWHKRGQNLTSVPVAIHRFYDQILSNPAKAAQNFTLLNETVKEDWTVRPNPADIVGGKGPGVVGLQRIMQLFGEIIPDLKFERKEMFIHEDKVVVLLKVSGTIEKAPEGEEFIPFFPGVAPSELVGKNFETLAVDIHSIVDGKIQQSYHIEDWRTAVYQMIKGEPVPDFGFHPEYIQFERFNLTEHTHRVPKAIENFYDKMINHLDTYGQNQTLINETFSEDFNMRPNQLSPQKGLHAGPLRAGIKTWFSLKDVMYKDINMTRMYTAEVGDIVLVVGNLSAKMNHIPPGLPGYPQYPGIPEHKLRNKHFNILTMDLHVMDNDKIRRQWHFADHQLGLKQMLAGEQNPSLTLEYGPRGKVLETIPESIYTLYDRILKNPQDTKDDSLFEEVYAEDFSKRPIKMADHDDVFRTQQGFPGIEGVKKMVRDFRDVVPDFEMERKATILHEDSVIVLSKMSGTIQNIGKIYDGQKENEISFLPGIPAEKFMGKRFETMHLAVHCIRDGKIKQTYHIEDWSTAIHQMLYNRPAPDFGFERDFVDF